MSAAPAGLVVVDKPAGMTSHDVVARVRRLAGTRKVGHAGTLDPMATGVLLVGVNRATRLLGHLTLTEKAYDATVRLGSSTTTDDAEGETLTTASVRHVTEDDVRSAAGAFVGDLEQKPSAVSAIKVDGKRAYARVRDGEDVDLPARPVTVHELRGDRRAPRRRRHRRRPVGALQQRHLHPRDRPRPRRGPRRRRSPHHAPAYGGRALHARRGARARRPGRLPSTSSASTTWPAAASPRTTSTPTRPRPSPTDGRSTRRSATRPRWRCSTRPGRFLALYEQRGDVAAPVAVFV